MRFDRFWQRGVLLAVVAVLSVAVLSTVGCSRGDRLETYPIDGKIVFSNGNPFAGGSQSFIVFQSKEHGVTATGVVELDGSFKVGTYDPEDGAVAGRHRVSISPPVPEGNPERSKAVSTFNSKYQSIAKSGIEVTVDPNGENQVTITLDAP